MGYKLVTQLVENVRSDEGQSCSISRITFPQFAVKHSIHSVEIVADDVFLRCLGFSGEVNDCVWMQALEWQCS